MVESSWRQRLHSAISRFTASPRPRARSEFSFPIEGLENRVVLTNSNPSATSEVLPAIEDQPLNGQLQGADIDGDVLTYHEGVLQPAHGEVSINSAGVFTYTPDINFNGNDSFSFFVTDGQGGQSGEATINVVVTAVNDAPTVINGSAAPSEDLAYPGTVAGQAFDADIDNLTFSAVTQPTHGTLTFNANGSFTYTPVANYNGPDSFTFRANDGQADSNVATFNLSVTPVDDPLALTLPTGVTVLLPNGNTQVGRNSSPVRIDPASTVKDVDTVVNYGKTQIRTTFSAGNTNGDVQNNRVALTVLSQGSGAGLVYVKGSKIYYNGNDTVPIASVTGGDLGHALVIKFSDAATEEAVNAVTRQISVKASKKAFVGSRTISVVLSAGGQKAVGTKSVSIV